MNRSVSILDLGEERVTDDSSQENVWIMIKDIENGPISPDEYDERTRWSDHSIIIPLLFNLLHGIELLVKGFVWVDADEAFKKEHNIHML